MDYVVIEYKGPVMVLTIDRQQALNALDKKVLQELKQAIDMINTDEIRCVVITGAGKKAFVAGADIAEMKSMTKEQGKEFCLTGNAVFRALEEMPVPVIAAVNGYALGGGCELSMACDIRIAAENAVFGQPEVGLGVTAGFGGTQRLPRLVGQGFAKELLFTADKIDAKKALAIGLVNAVYPQEELMDRAMKLAEKIAANAPIAVRATKIAIQNGLDRTIDEGIAVEAEQFASCFETEDQTGAMTALLEKRKYGPFLNR